MHDVWLRTSTIRGTAIRTAFGDLPDEWICPECGVCKEESEVLEAESEERKVRTMNKIERAVSCFNDGSVVRKPCSPRTANNSD
jgi:hypothetical protein